MMSTSSLKRERSYLIVSACGNFVVGCVAVVVAAFSSSQAILLDGLFNLTYFATGLFTIKVATLVAGGDDERYPHGYAFFEPLVNGMKGMLVLGVSVMALAGAISALMAGGREIVAGQAIAYGTFASLTCWFVAWFTHRGAEATHSPLVRADAENWVVNAAISSCVLLAFAGIFLLKQLELDHLAIYVDPCVVIAVVLISLGVPVRMAWRALMDLLNRAPRREVVQQVEQLVNNCLGELPLREQFVRVIQPGRLRLVLVHAVLEPDFKLERLGRLDVVREQTHHALQKIHHGTVVDIVFTADRKWGAPLSDGGMGPIAE